MWFPFHLEKVEKETKCWRKNINMYCPPITGLKTSWNFTTIYSLLRDSLAQSFKKREEKTKKENQISRGKLEWLAFASQTGHNVGDFQSGN